MSEFDDHQLRLAMAYHLIDSVVTADGEVGPGEAAYMNMLFPRSIMQEEGFCDDDGVPTTALDEAMKMAVRVMPGRMDLDAKLELLTMCVDASLADSNADSYELVLVRVAARVLGVTDDQLDAHLATLPTIGEVDLGDMEANDAVTASPPPIRHR